MAGLEAARKDQSKQRARIEAIKAAYKRDPSTIKRRSETLKATLAAKKARVPQKWHNDLCSNTEVDTVVSSVGINAGKACEFDYAYLKSGPGHSKRPPAGIYDPESPSVTYSIPGEWD